MVYLGNVPAEAYTSTVKDSFNGDASTTAFTLSQPSTTNNLRVVVENVIQDPTVAYSVSGTTLTFTSAPPSGTANIYAVHLGPATMTAVPPTEITNATTYTSDLTVQGDMTVDTNTLYVDSANNLVGISTASPDDKLHVNTGNLRFTRSLGSTGEYARIVSYNTLAPANPATNIRFLRDVAVYGNDGAIAFDTRNSERVRIHSGGQLSLFTTSTVVGGKGCRFTLDQDNASGYAFGVDRVRNTNDSGGILIRNGDTQGTMYAVSFFNTSNSHVGSIVTSNGGTSFNTSSDYRLKENVIELTGAIDRVKQVPVHRFNFIAEPDKTVDGFLAHEVAEVVPEAIHGEKDAMRTEEYEVTPAVLDDDGNVVTEAVMGTREVPEYQGIDQSKLVPLLTQALKDAITKIEALEVSNADLLVRLEALENGA